MKILVCNAGSTSLKFKLYSFPSKEVICKARIERIGDELGIYNYQSLMSNYSISKNTPIKTYEDGINMFLGDMENSNCSKISELNAIGFKTVLSKDHLGVYIIDDGVIKGMEEYMEVAPAHNGPYLKAIRLFQKLLPSVTLVGVFETDFHKNISKEKYIYSVPYEWYEKYGVRKFGYHGASHYYSTTCIENEFGKDKKIISLHLGGSCSAAAIINGESIDTSFGMSLQTGILNNNRIGDIDSFIIPYMCSKGIDVNDVAKDLITKSGLKGVSGISGDMRDLFKAKDEGNERAKLAIDVFVYSILKYIGLFYIELGGLDVLSFTAGIGESQPEVRKMVCDKIKHLGVELDEVKNANPKLYGGTISKDSSKVVVKVIEADEEIVVATKAYNIISK